jgi:hypothetical protein
MYRIQPVLGNLYVDTVHCSVRATWGGAVSRSANAARSIAPFRVRGQGVEDLDKDCVPGI